MRKLLSATVVCPLVAIPSLALAQSSVPGWITPERWNKVLDAAAVETPKLITTLIVPFGDPNPRLQAKDKVDEVARCDDIEWALTPSTT